MRNWLLVFVSLCFYSLLDAQQLPAFEGAQGGGMFTSGGRGGEVIYVTSLDDDGKKGSLRWAVKQSYARTILFKVAGTIELIKPLEIKIGNVTIAGQSAPGDGICIKNYPVKVEADNVVLRYLRFRMGDEKGVEDDALGGRFCRNVIIDHCSISWSTDECASFYGNVNFTMQWCLIAESLNQSVHSKGAHGYGAIWGGKNASFHHNLLVHHNSRNARFDHPDIYKSVSPIDSFRGNVEFVNNVVYNWKSHAAYGGEGGSFNMVGNYYKPGPESKKKDFMLEPYSEIATPGKFYLQDNIMEGNGAVNADNMKGVKFTDGLTPEQVLVKKPFDIVGGVVAQKAKCAFDTVLASAGASHVRDAVDARLVKEVKTGSYTFWGSKGGFKGLIDSQSDVGGWPVLKGGEPALDTDGDGLPDDWELKHKLDPQNGQDAKLKHKSGYTWLEIYLDSIVK